MSETAKLTLGDKTFELPVITGTENEKAIDIRKLRGETGYVTIDNGFMNTASCESAVTFLDGEKGILRYRGYPIEQIADQSSFVEASYLVNYGELPTKEELDFFNEKMTSYCALPQGITNILDQFPRDSHPMGVLSAGLCSLSAFYPEFLVGGLSHGDEERALAQLMAQAKTILAYFYRKSIGKEPIRSHPSMGFCADFLNMMFNDGDNKVDEKIAKALDVLLILHVDHEQNCSASTVRVIGSSQANVFASIAGGVNALWGQLHGGANQAVLTMLEEIQQNGGDHKDALARAKDKNDPFKLMGFGHRVYKNFDPRARIIKVACDEVLAALNVKDPLLDIARGLEEEALKDPYFVERNLYPNVDFYSGIIYKALGIPTNMFTAMFAIGRMPGWIAQWKEMRETAGIKISRPRQIYVGENERNYTDINNR